MSGVATPPPASQAELDAVEARIDAVETDMLTGADRQQAVRVQLTPNANGEVVYTYPKPYVTGTKPAIQTTAETPTGVAYRNDASVVEGSATNTQVTILVQRVPKTLTVSILGAVLNIFTPVTTPVWVNIFIRAPV
jgi:hypothetical protein